MMIYSRYSDGERRVPTDVRELARGRVFMSGLSQLMDRRDADQPSRRLVERCCDADAGPRRRLGLPEKEAAKCGHVGCGDPSSVSGPRLSRSWRASCSHSATIDDSGMG